MEIESLAHPEFEASLPHLRATGIEQFLLDVLQHNTTLLRCRSTGDWATSLNIPLSGELRAKGRDLVYALGKENFKTDVLGGGNSIGLFFLQNF